MKRKKANKVEALRRCDLATKQDLKKMEKRIMATLQEILDDVTDESTVIDGVVTLLNQLSTKLAEAIASNDPAKIQAVKDLIDTNKAKMAAAVQANTPPVS